MIDVCKNSGIIFQNIETTCNSVDFKNFRICDSSSHISEEKMIKFHYTTMRVQYVMVFFILTEARKTKKKKSEPEDEITVSPYERYYRVPFGTITLEGFNPLAKGPIEYDHKDSIILKSFKNTETPDLVPFVPNNEDNIKSKKSKWKRSKENKKKRDQGSKTFGVSPGRKNDAPKRDDDLLDGSDEDSDKKESRYSNFDRAGMYIDFTKNFMSSIGHNYRDGKQFSHGSLPDQVLTTPEPTKLPPHVVEDVYYPERKIKGYPKYPLYSYVPPHIRNGYLDDKMSNWTTCEEFGRDAVFYPKDVIDVEWVPFFVWTNRDAMIDSIIHTFEYPTIKLVQKYKKAASPLLKKKLDWEAPKLMMKLKTLNNNDDMLIIAADRKGKFDGLRYMEIPEGVKELQNAMPYPVMSLHLKSLGSYLAMMSCIDHYAVIMAPAGTEPKNFEAARRGAAFLNFTGTGYALQRNLLKEKMILQTQKDIEARLKAREENKKWIPPAPRDSVFPFNREPAPETL